MAQPQKLQIPQLDRIRAEDVHVADAFKTIADNFNQNVTPVVGNKIVPLNPLK